MKLHDRDYMILRDDERRRWERLKEKEVERLGKLTVRKSRFRDYPKAARHYESLFPNQYMDIVELQEEERLYNLVRRFEALLDEPNVNERKIIDFISARSAHFIIGALLKNYYTFGHHDAYLFPEFPLGTTYRADYLLVGRSSDGWSFVFVELESPQQKATLANGDLAMSFRKGLNQIADWDTWLGAHFNSLAEVFEKSVRPGQSLDSEFRNYDRSRIHFVVVAGRRDDFLDKTYAARRKKLRDSADLILHYDNVIDAAENVIGAATY